MCLCACDSVPTMRVACGAIQIIFEKRANRVPPRFRLLAASSSPYNYYNNCHNHRARTGSGTQHCPRVTGTPADVRRALRLRAWRVEQYKNKIKMNSFSLLLLLSKSLLLRRPLLLRFLFFWFASPSKNRLEYVTRAAGLARRRESQGHGDP